MDNDAKIVRLGMGASKKMMQSEMGVTGETSPNFEIMQDAIINLRNTFKHEHGEDSLTEEDSLLVISGVCLGKPIAKKVEQTNIAIASIHKGCMHHTANAVAGFLYSYPEFIQIFQTAITTAIIALDFDDEDENEGGGK